MNDRPKMPLEVVCDTIRRKHYSHRTEKSYLQWIKRYLIFHQKRHPREMGKPEVEAFLTYLAVEGKFSASTQNQAFNGILFLYREVFDQPLENVQAFRAKQISYLPVVLSPQEVRSIIAEMNDTDRLTIQLLYRQQFQIQNDFTPFQRSPELSRIVKFSWCEAFRAIKF